jgi:hypothetical protein
VGKTIPVLTGGTLENSAEGQNLVEAPVKEKVTLETAIGRLDKHAVDRFHRGKAY